jgi:four helix bundle protein
MAESYENLRVWEDAVDLAVEIYGLTKHFPKEELFGITSQLRRAVVSVSSNIAEGAGRGSKGDYCRFLDISIGSLPEVENLLVIAYRLDYLTEKQWLTMKERTGNIGMMLGGLKKYLQKRK